MEKALFSLWRKNYIIKKILKVIKFIFLEVIFFSLAFSIELEEGIVELRINKSVNMILVSYYDEDNKPWVALEELFSGVGVKEYSLRGDEVTYKLNGSAVKKKINMIDYEDKKIISSDGISSLFEGLNIKWEPDSLLLEIETALEMPLDFLANQEEKRKKLNDLEGEVVIKERWKGFTPGVLYLGYHRYSLSRNSYFIRGNYTNHLLYGNFNLNGSVQNGKFSIDNYTWKRNVGDERRLTLGSNYRNTPFSVGKNSSLKGISIRKKNSWDQALDVDNKNIRGIAPNSSTVELYENGILRDYLIVQNGEFNFEIETVGGARNYEVRIYNLDGTVERIPVAIYGSKKLVNKHNFDYEFQGGVSDANKNFIPYNLILSYGLTEDFTINIGGYNANVEEKEKTYMNLSPIYRVGSIGEWSHLLALDISGNLFDSEEYFYKTEILSGNSRFQNTFGIENYKNADLDFIDKGYDEKIYWRSNFPINTLNIGWSFEKGKASYNNEEIERYGITAYESLFKGRVLGSIDYKREKRKSLKNENIANKLRVGASYYIRNKKLTRYLETITLDFELIEEDEDNYGVTLQKNRDLDKNLDYYIKLKRQGRETILEASMTYKFGDYFNIRSNNIKRGADITHGVEVNTIVNFSGTKKIHYSEYMGDSSIKGVVFLDKNNNEVLDEDEERISNVFVESQVGSVLSNNNGEYYIPLITSQAKNELYIENRNEEYLLNYNTPKKYTIKALPGGKMELNIPVRLIKTIVGTIEFDNSFYLEEVEEVLSNLSLRIIDLKSGKVIKSKISNEYIILELPQRRYALEVSYDGKEDINELDGSFILDITGEEKEEYLSFNILKSEDEEYTLELLHNGKILLKNNKN